ncbi:MAG: ABC transporter ATP-binding protein [Chthonomonas sp.]|nr:ABC transporter ATP-binding protein [Chthonomonas sp.]
MRDVDLQIPAATATAIIGPNGAGKSTLLKAILGLVPPVIGEVTVFGDPLSEAIRRVSYVPQRETVDWDFPIQVLDVVLMGTYREVGWFRRPGASERERAREALAKLGVADLAHSQIGQLSGGQQQRVFLARALVQASDLMILDEPLAGVDAATEEVIFDLLAELVREGKTILAVHHDLDTVRANFQHVVLVKGGVVAAGGAGEVLQPDLLKAAYGKALFLGSS